MNKSSLLINLRELINLYIADGFYRQTNYMNSKLSLYDLH